MNNVRMGGSGGGEEQDPVRVSENIMRRDMAPVQEYTDGKEEG
jgi:hypothetical protein